MKTKAQSMGTNTIILLILGLVVLVILIIGFTSGWDKVFPFIGGGNVDKITSACSAACVTGSTYDYCSVQRTLKAKTEETGKTVSIKTSCAVFAGVSEFQKYGVEQCSTVECALPCNDITINGKAGQSSGDYDVSLVASGTGNCFVASA